MPRPPHYEDDDTDPGLTEDTDPGLGDHTDPGAAPSFHHEELEHEDTDPGAAEHHVEQWTGMSQEEFREAPPPPEMEYPDIPEVRFHWGPIVLFAVYAVVCSVYFTWASYNAPDNRWERMITAADQLLGDEQGKDKSEEELIEAAKAYMEILLENPNLKYPHDQIESIKWRFQERQLSFPNHLDRRLAALAKRSRAGKEATGLFKDMAITAEDAYNISETQAAVRRQSRWAIIAGVPFLLWALISSYMRRQDDVRRREEYLAHVKKNRTQAMY